MVVCGFLNTHIIDIIYQSYDLACWIRNGNCGIERSVQKHNWLGDIPSDLNHFVFLFKKKNILHHTASPLSPHQLTIAQYVTLTLTVNLWICHYQM